MTIDPDDELEAVTPADTLTSHDDVESPPSDQPVDHVDPGIIDPRRSRVGPELLEPPVPGVSPPE